MLMLHAGGRCGVPPWAKWDNTADVAAPCVDWQDSVVRRVPLDGDLDDPRVRSELEAYIKNAAQAVNWHRHTHTCKKGGRQGDHTDCRMNFDLPLVPKTCRLADSTFVVRRDHGMLVPFNPAMLLAFPANHMLQLSCEGSKWLRQAMLFKDATAAADSCEADATDQVGGAVAGLLYVLSLASSRASLRARTALACC